MFETFSIQEVSRQILTQEKTLIEINEYLPCHSHINSLEDFSILETDNKILHYFDMSLEDINAGGFGLLQRIVNKEDLSNAVNLNINYLDNLEKMTHVSFFQRLKFNTLKEEQLFYTRGKILDDKRIFNLSIPIQNIDLFNHKVSDVYENTHFIRANVALYNQLSKRELLISKYLIKGNTMKEIATELAISTHTIKNHKSSIYKKLSVKNYFEFYNFVAKFKLVDLNEY